ncbi:MAG: hypothetical protein ACOY46_07950 [Bacillota bacterium]
MKKGFALGLQFHSHMEALCFLKPYLDYLDVKTSQQILEIVKSIPDCSAVEPFTLNPSEASPIVKRIINDSPLTDIVQRLIHIYSDQPYSPVGRVLKLAVEAIAYKNLLGSTEIKYLINETHEKFHFSVLGIWIDYSRRLISVDSPEIQRGKLQLGPWIPNVQVYPFDSNSYN